MSTVEALIRALAEEAGAVEVDVLRLHHEFLARRVDHEPKRRRTPLLLAAAAATVAVTIGCFVVTHHDPQLAAEGSNGTVATTFACPEVASIDFATETDDGFLPDLSHGATPADVARQEHAPTYVFDVDGDRAQLRLGNADGSLGSVTTYDLVDGRWEMRTAQVCSGVGDQPLTDVPGALTLGQHGQTPWPADRFGTMHADAAFVDDRPYYNLAGVIEGHRSMYVEPCGRHWCWYAGEPDSFLRDWRNSTVDSGVPIDVSKLLVNPDMMVGRKNAFAVWAMDGTSDQLRSFSVTLDDGTVIEATTFTSPSWDGRRVLVVLAPAAELVSLQATYGDGSHHQWKPKARD